MPRPIRDRVDYANTCEICDAMAVHLEQFTTDQEDYFDLLRRLIRDLCNMAKKAETIRSYVQA